MYKHDQRLIWGSGSQHGGCLAPSLLGFWGSQPKELQKRCWNSHSWWRANPIPVALPLLAACCCFCSHFSTSVSLADAIPKNRGTSAPGWWPWGEVSAALVCSGLSGSLPRQWCFATIKERAWALPSRKELAVLASLVSPWALCTDAYLWCVPSSLPHPQRCLQDLPNGPMDVTLWMGKENLM